MKTLILLIITTALAAALNFTMDVHNFGSLRANLIANGNLTDFLEEQNRHRYTNLFTHQRPLYDYFDQFYLGTVNVGTPAQVFYLSMDTGSSNMWVIAQGCAQPQCTGYPSSYRPKLKYRPGASSTFKKIPQGFYMYYHTGSVSGYYATDRINFAGVRIENQKFGVATAIANVFGYQPIDGVFGLGWPSLAVGNVKTPMEAILPQLDKKLFTVWLGRRTTTAYGALAGSIQYGALDTTHCDSAINWVPLSKAQYWQFPIQGFQLGQFIRTSVDQVITDTGTSFIGAPMGVLNGIIQMTGAKYSNKNQIYVVPCTTMFRQPNALFKINGNQYVIPSSQYVLDLKLGNGYCALAFFGIQAGGFGTPWILGDPFIRTYCHVHDFENKRIGLSLAKNM
ncbi:eukaryotic aspartyl protease [Ancylostoma caninum]|uniref:Eukaryotic aspartyl protease n=1 Tax=Ancylostoma caninum TaxID=29170 RepID=A0A368FLJ5_ANCCA|nr:eukaryotic aspartyl protease [Ancylostoma caninum]